MIFTETKLQGCYTIKPKMFEDERGYFFESFNQKQFEENIGKINFVQDNQSKSEYGVTRALHYQVGDFAQAKLVRVLEGRVLDVAVDLRKDSKTFGQHFAIELSAQNQMQLFVPRGFAHGFSTLSPSAVFFYKCDNFYNKQSEGGIIYNDQKLNINWGVPKESQKLSEKDLLLPKFDKARL